MPDEQPFAVQASLMRHYSREVAAGDALAMTVNALCRSDISRLTFWDGDLVEPSATFERVWVLDAEERLAIEFASRDPHLDACLGFVAEQDRDRPQSSAWLLDRRSGKIIDLARCHRRAIGFYGVQLRPGEVANWTEAQPHLVAERNVSRLAV